MNITTKHVVITPSDSVSLPLFAAIMVIDGGDVALEDREGTQITYPNVPPYTTIEGFSPSKVLSTGTAATNIVGWLFVDGR